VARVLSVLVTDHAIEDGAIRPPVVGEVGSWRLTFAEVGDDDPRRARVRARADPLSTEPPRPGGRRWNGAGFDRVPAWPTLLTGEGWSAVWAAPRPVVGEVELHGSLRADLVPGTAHLPTRGRVTRVQVVSMTHDPVERQRWLPAPGGWRLRDVAAAPRWFDSGTHPPPDMEPGGFYALVPDDPWVQEIGVLIDLDLDDVPALPLRPPLVPGAVAAHGADLWVADDRLPLLARLRVGDDAAVQVVAEHAWPGGVLAADRDGERTLHADAGGCWLTGPDGVHRCDADGPVTRVDEAPVGPAAGHDGTLATVVLGDPHGGTRLRLSTRAGAVTDVPAAADRVAGLVTVDGGFLLLLRSGDGMRLVSLDPGGTLSEGPSLTAAGDVRGLVGGQSPFLTGTDGHRQPVDAHLQAGPPLTGSRALADWAVDGRSWSWTHPPEDRDPTSAGIDPAGHGRYWLLSEVDPVSGEPRASVAVTGPPQQVGLLAGRAVWLQNGAVRRWPLTGEVPEELDVAGALQRYRER
jgi:hypothetical protein